MDSVLTCLVSDSIGPGSLTDRVVDEVKAYLGLQGGLALREPYRALELALRALEAAAGAEVILSPLSPVMYHDACVSLGLTPRYADVDPSSGCLTPNAVEAALTAETAAVLVHYPLGFVPDVAGIAELGVPVVEDISHAFGGNDGQRKAGAHGSFVLVSLEADGMLTAGGGALALARGKRELGKLRKQAAQYGRNVVLPDMNAALVLPQLRNIEANLQRRRDIAQVYSRALAGTRHAPLVQQGEAENVYYSFAVLLAAGLREVTQYGRKKGVDVIQAFGESVLALRELPDGGFPNARPLLLRCVLFPLYPNLGKKNVNLVERVLTTLP